MNDDFPFDQFFNFKDKKPVDQVIKNQQIQDITAKTPEETTSSGLESDFEKEELAIMTSELLEHLKQNINEKKFNAYFSGTFQIKNIVDDSIICSVTTGFIKKIIESQYTADIENIFKSFLGKNYNLKIEVLGETLSTPVAPLETTSENSMNTNSFKEEYVVNKANTIKDVSFTINENELFYTNKK